MKLKQNKVHLCLYSMKFSIMKKRKEGCMMFCHQCGKEIGEAKFCPYCGTKQEGFTDTQQTEQPAEQQITAQPEVQPTEQQVTAQPEGQATQSAYRPIEQQPFVGGQGQQAQQQAPRPTPNYSQSREVDAPNGGFAVLAFFIPLVGLILFLIWNKDYPQKAKSCLKGMITGIVTYVVLFVCLFAAIFAIADRYENDFYDDFYYSYTVVETVPYE